MERARVFRTAIYLRHRSIGRRKTPCHRSFFLIVAKAVATASLPTAWSPLSEDLDSGSVAAWPKTLPIGPFLSVRNLQSRPLLRRDACRCCGNSCATCCTDLLVLRLRAKGRFGKMPTWLERAFLPRHGSAACPAASAGCALPADRYASATSDGFFRCGFVSDATIAGTAGDKRRVVKQSHLNNQKAKADRKGRAEQP